MIIILLSLGSVHANNLTMPNTELISNQTIIIDNETSYENINIIAEKNTVFNISSNGKLILNNSIISGANTAIYNKGLLIIINCTFINNTGINGAAIYNDGKLKIINSIFINNKVSNSGGVIYNNANNIIIENSIFDSNTATTKNGEIKGGAIYNIGENLTIKNCTFIKNGVSNTYKYENQIIYGGAIYNNANDLTIINSKFSYNYGYGRTDSSRNHVDCKWKYGGAIYCINSNNTIILNNTFYNNELYTIESTYEERKITGNYMNAGASIYMESSNNLIIKDNTFINNTSSHSTVTFSRCHNSILDNNTFFENKQKGIFIGSSVEIFGSNWTVSNNHIDASDRTFGLSGIHISILYSNITFINNVFSNLDRGVYYDGTSKHTDGNITFIGNIFTTVYTGIKLPDLGGNMLIDSNIFNDTFNAVQVGVPEGNCIVTNNYFYGQDDSNYKGQLLHGIYFGGLNVLIENNIFNNNHLWNASNPGYAMIHVDATGNNTIKNNIISNNSCERIFEVSYNCTFQDNIITNNKGIVLELYSRLPNDILNIINNTFIDNDLLINGTVRTSNLTYYLENNKIYDYSGDINDYVKNLECAFEEKNTNNFSEDLPLNKLISNFVNNLLEKINNNFKNNTQSEINNSYINSTQNSNSNQENSSDNLDDGNAGLYDYSSTLNQINVHDIEKISDELNSKDSTSSKDSKSYELNKKTSKEITNNNLTIALIISIVIIFLMIIGYYKKN